MDDGIYIYNIYDGWYMIAIYTMLYHRWGIIEAPSYDITSLRPSSIELL